MRLSLALAALVPLAFAQESSSSAPAPSGSAVPANGTASGNSTAGGNGTAEYATTVLAALRSANLTGLAGIAEMISTTPEGQEFFTQLQQGNKTVFAPNDQALSTVSEEVSSNNQLLTQILAYHVLNNTYTSDGIATAPAHTLGRTLLKGGNYTLPGNRSQPLVLAKSSNSTNGTSFDLVGSSSNITVTGNATKAANLEIYVVDRVIPIPPRIEEIAPQLVPQLAGVLNTTNLLDPLKEAQGITVFAPNDAALQAAQGQLASLSQENITAIVSNHVINGTVVYSNNLGAANATSAGGAPFTFASNDTGAFVTSGNSTARIVQSDIIIANGVVHVIDGLLVNSQSNPEAAASAASSASEAAATATDTDPTGPVTATGDQTSAPAGQTGAGGGSGAVGLGFSGVTVGLTAVGLAVGLLVV